MIKVRFQNSTYASTFALRDAYGNNHQVVVVESVPAKVFSGYGLKETDDAIKLIAENTIFNMENGIATFTPAESTDIWIFNKKEETWGSVTDNELFNINENDEVCLPRKNYHRSPDEGFLAELMFSVINYINPYLGTKMLATSDIYHQSVTNYSINNLYKLTNREMAIAADKIFSAMGPSFFYSQIASENGLVMNTSGKKARQLIGLPDRVMDYLKSNNRSSLANSFRIICEDDPNEGIVVLDYFEKLRKIKTFKKLDDTNEEYNFITHLSKAKAIRPEIKVARVIRYMMKQRFAYSFLQYLPISWGNRENTREIFMLPNSELSTYVDYLNMSNKDSELYPRNLFSAHNVCVRNIKILKNPELAKLYEASVQAYEAYCYEKKDYIITYPKTIEELVYEGNYLEHCVATYAEAIANNATKVFCLRKADEPTVPFVTIEVDNDNNIVQVKEKYDLDVTEEEVLNFLKKWRKEKLN